jgi:serine protease
MQKTLLLFACLLFLCVSSLQLLAQTAKPKPQYVTGLLHVKLKPEQAGKLPTFAKGQAVPETMPQVLKAIAHTYGFTAIETMAIGDDANMKRWFLVRFTNHAQTEALLRELGSTNLFEVIEQVPIRRKHRTVNDPQYGNQWYLAKIGAPAAWDVSTGSATISIAILDDGILTSHQDLAPRILVNTADPVNSSDDDNNGFIDDNKGWDFGDGDNNPDPVILASDSMSHGTHCAGIAAASTDDGTGIASLAFNVKILPVKLGNDVGYGLGGSTAQAIAYAAQRGARVISMSFGGPNFSQAEQDAVTAAHNAGAVLLAAAGNDNSESLDTIGYPARYTNIIMVASSDQGDLKSSFSNYNAAVTITAPGTAITSSYAIGGASRQRSVADTSYATIDGTSMATPLVASLCGLILSANSSLTPTQVRNILTSTAVNLDNLNPSYAGKLGAGRINASAAMQAVTTARESNSLAGSGFLMYPNPATDAVFLTPKVESETKYVLQLSDVMGRVVLTREFRATAPTEVPIADLTKGIYQLVLTSPAGQETLRLVKN